MKRNNNMMIFFLIFVITFKNVYSATFKGKSELSNSNLSSNSGTSASANLINSKIGGSTLIRGKSSDKKNLNAEVLNSDIGWQGWVSYSKSPSEDDYPNHLFINEKYDVEKQLLQAGAANSKKQAIPNNSSFYLSLKGNVISLAYNTDIFNNIVDSIDLKKIAPFLNPESQDSIEFSQFYDSKYCMNIYMIDRSIWVICNSTFNQRQDLFNSILKGITALNDSLINFFSQDATESNYEQRLTQLNISVMEEEKVRKEMANVKIGDGYWKLLQDWSQCSLACGGGESLQQWFCVPPRPGKAPCIGSAILKKSCNIKPCPFSSSDESSSSMSQTSSSNSNSHSQTTQTISQELDPIVKVEKFLSKPQRYEKYIIYEKDVLRVMNNFKSALGKKPKAPIRLVINKLTITGYQSSDPNSTIFSYNLNNLSIANDEDYCCLVLNKEETICGGFGDSCGTKDKPEWVINIKAVLSEFMSQYKSLPSKSKESNIDNTDLEMVKLDVVKDREELIKKKEEEAENIKLDFQEKEVEQNLSQVLQREYNLEKMIEEEERNKVLTETRELLEAKKKEEEKSKCFDKVLKAKEEQEQMLQEKDSKIETINTMKSIAQIQVEQQRAVFKNRIKEIRKKAQRKFKKIQNDITVIRNQITENMIKAKAKGDKAECTSRRSSKAKVEEYCNWYHNVDPEKNLQCKQDLNFCVFCCQDQFGSFYLTDKNKCINECDSIAVKAETSTAQR